jgi:hypothetical protein
MNNNILNSENKVFSLIQKLPEKDQKAYSKILEKAIKLDKKAREYDALSYEAPEGTKRETLKKKFEAAHKSYVEQMKKIEELEEKHNIYANYTLNYARKAGGHNYWRLHPATSKYGWEL